MALSRSASSLESPLSRKAQGSLYSSDEMEHLFSLDTDSPEAGLPRPILPGQVFLRRFVTSWPVEALLIALILLSLGVIAIETDRLAAGLAPLDGLDVVNYGIMAVYTTELIMKLYVFRCKFFLTPWNCLDFFIVQSDLVMVVVEVFLADTASLSLLRVLRLLRLARGARVLRHFPQLALMVKGLFATLNVMFSGLLLLAGALVILGILGTQILHPVNQRVASKGVYDNCERCHRASESTISSATTFVQQIVTGDSWGTLSIPIMEEEPATAIFFAIVFSFLQLMVLNVILSMVVNTSLKTAEEDSKRILKEKEFAYKTHVRTFRQLCAELDTDNSGTLTKSELLSGFVENPEFQEVMQLMDFSFEDLDAVFGILDTDNSGDLSYEEFACELYKMKTHDSHTLLVFIKYYVSEIKDMMRQVLERELTALHHALGVNAGDDRASEDVHPAVEAPLLEPVPLVSEPLKRPSQRRHSVYSALCEAQECLQQDVSRMLEELLRKVQCNTEMLQELRPTEPRCIGRWPAAAREPPRRLPQPRCEDAGEGMQLPVFADDVDQATTQREAEAQSRPKDPGKASKTEACGRTIGRASPEVPL